MLKINERRNMQNNLKKCNALPQNIMQNKQ